jgi:hypothetical protein
MKPLPFTVKVKDAAPALVFDGDREVFAGTGLVVLMVRAMLPEAPPPGDGLNTVIWAVPAAEMSAAEIAACNCVEAIHEVVLTEPFHWTAEPTIKPLPFTVRVKAAPPAIAEDGEIVLIVGIGALMVKAELLEVPPPGDGLNTVTWTVPALAMSAALMAACNCVALT